MLNTFIMLFPIIPIILLVVTICLGVNAHNKLSNFSECPGTIVDFYENTSELRVGTDATKAISPIVVYNVNGREYKFTGNYCSTSMKVGDTVKVMYDSNNYENATLKTGLYVAPIITGGLALFFGIACIILFVLKSKGII